MRDDVADVPWWDDGNAGSWLGVVALFAAAIVVLCRLPHVPIRPLPSRRRRVPTGALRPLVVLCGASATVVAAVIPWQMLRHLDSPSSGWWVLLLSVSATVAIGTSAFVSDHRAARISAYASAAVVLATGVLSTAIDALVREHTAVPFGAVALGLVFVLALGVLAAAVVGTPRSRPAPRRRTHRSASQRSAD